MINPLPFRYQIRFKHWLRRLDRATAEMNVILAAMVIGLSVLDGTVLVTERVIERLPPMNRLTLIEAPPQQPPPVINPLQ